MRIASWAGILCMLGITAAVPSRAAADDDEEDEVEEAPRKAKRITKQRRALEADDDERPKRAGKRAIDDESREADDEDVADAEEDDGEVLEDVAAPAITKQARPARKAERFYFRAGIAHVEPRTRSTGMKLEPVGIAALMPMEPPKGEIVTDPANVFTAILGVAPATFGGYLAFETLIGIPKKSKLRATGDLANKSLAPMALDLIPTGVPPLGEEIGEASAAPLMVTATVRTPELGGRVRLYAGGGPSVLIVRGAKVTNKVLTEVATPRIETSPTVGVVAQAGIDVRLYKRIYARLDIKEMWFRPAETRISNIHVRTTIPLLDTIEVGSSSSQVQANPLVVQFGIGAGF